MLGSLAQLGRTQLLAHLDIKGLPGDRWRDSLAWPRPSNACSADQETRHTAG